MYGYQQPPQPMYGGQVGFQQPPAFQQPMMPQPMFVPPPPPQGPTIVTISNRQEGTKCPYCGQQSENRTRKSAGCATWGWCVCLAFTVPPLFFIPFCVDGCKDVELVCEKCGQVKNTIKANCCWYISPIKCFPFSFPLCVTPVLHLHIKVTFASKSKLNVQYLVASMACGHRRILDKHGLPQFKKSNRWTLKCNFRWEAIEYASGWEERKSRTRTNCWV